MDGTQDGLTGSSEFTEERDDEVGTLAVETGSRFIEEQQGTERQFNSPTDGNRTHGLLTSSTPIVRRFLCSTPRPAPGCPMRASSMSCSSRRSMMTST